MLMYLHDVCKQVYVRKSRKRVGRGIGSGCGKTSGRGHKGAGSRSGHSSRLAFEGGQTAIFRRVAKRGQSKPHYSVEVKTVDVSVLARGFQKGDMVDSVALFENAMISRIDQSYKILGSGLVSIQLHLRVRAISRAAANLITSVGGTVEIE